LSFVSILDGWLVGWLVAVCCNYNCQFANSIDRNYAGYHRKIAMNNAMKIEFRIHSIRVRMRMRMQRTIEMPFPG